jgi:hypothetical protein
MTTTPSTSLVDIRAQLKAQLEAQRSRIEGPSSSRISTAGKQFTLPDGRTSQGPLSLVILDWRITHAYYTGIYDPAKPKAPDCWAISETINCAPDPGKVRTPKHASCNGCPFNEYGTASVGRGKACKETRRLAVAPLDAQVGDKPFLLEVSPTGIRSFESLVTALSAKGLTPLEVVAEVGFKSDATYPTLVFAPAAALDEDQLATMFEIRSRAAAVLDRDMSMD